MLTLPSARHNFPENYFTRGKGNPYWLGRDRFDEVAGWEKLVRGWREKDDGGRDGEEGTKEKKRPSWDRRAEENWKVKKPPFRRRARGVLTAYCETSFTLSFTSPFFISVYLSAYIHTHTLYFFGCLFLIGESLFFTLSCGILLFHIHFILRTHWIVTLCDRQFVRRMYLVVAAYIKAIANKVQRCSRWINCWYRIWTI